MPWFDSRGRGRLSDKNGMEAAVSPSRVLIRLSMAGVKRLRSVFRDAGVGREHPDWKMRADVCVRCPLCIIEGKSAYCGKPFLRHIDRDEATEGCGCPIVAKAKDPAEHCPRDRVFNPSSKDAACDCMWCIAQRART